MLDVRVPNLVLQPLVENAVKYGTVHHPGKHRIEIRARHQGGALCIEVEDDGAGLPATEIVEGIGLGNTRARLRHLYGTAHKLERLRGGTLGGLLVALTIPERGDFDAGSSEP